MSSGIRRLEKKTGSAGMRNLGSRLNNRPNSAPRPANSTTRPDNIPLAAATGLSAPPAQPPVDTRSSVEYTLVSSTRPARTHNVMRLLTPKSVDLQTFTPPVKLRRRNKEYYRLKNKKRNEEKAEALEAEEKKKRQQLEADGVLMEVDGVAEVKKEESSVPIYMVKEKPKVDINLIADRGGARSNKRNLFKKKTKQVFFADEEKRRLDIEEARPWVLEDDDEKEVWTGSLEGGQNSTYVLFVLTDDGFKVVPVDRWYKFTPKLKYKTLTLDEAEEELKRAQKSEAQDRWIMHKRMVRLDVDADGEGPAAPGRAERAQGGGGMPMSRSKLVEREIDDDIGFDDDDDDDDAGGRGKAPKRRGSEGGRQGGEDFDFEMEFDDDEELGDVQFEYNEEEASQKKEQRQKASGAGYGSEGEEDEEDDQAAGKSKSAAKHADLRKSLRKREGRSEYKSDDEDVNPYLTPSDSDSDEEEEEEDPDKKKDAEKPEDAAAAGSAKPASGAQQTGKPAAAAANPANAAAAAAKKRKRVSVAPTGHQHHQPHARASSPASAASSSSADPRKLFKANAPGSGRPAGAASPTSSSGSPPPSSPASADLITKQEIVDLIKSGVNTTKKLITCVRKKLKANPANKVRIQAIVKEVATLKDGELALKRA
ncbi:transcription factor IIF subunit tfg1 [Coemansia sp. S610]|nr:transcription factor IIF subunit tfg1 [Coemansia sp. S610]